MLQRPYRDGKLAEKWQSYLAARGFNEVGSGISVAALWADIINTFPSDESEGPQEQQSGAYLNACYWEDILRQTTGLQKGDYEGLLAGLRDFKSRHNNGRGFTTDDFRQMFVNFRPSASLSREDDIICSGRLRSSA